MQVAEGLRWIPLKSRSAETPFKRSDCPKMFQIVASLYWRLKQGRGRSLQAEATFPNFPQPEATYQQVASLPNVASTFSRGQSVASTFLSIKEGFHKLKRQFHQEMQPEAKLLCKVASKLLHVASPNKVSLQTNSALFNVASIHMRSNEASWSLSRSRFTFPQVASSACKVASDPEIPWKSLHSLFSCCSLSYVVFSL